MIRPAGPPPVERWDLDVLIPTAGRPGALAVTLAALLAQDAPARLVIADQTVGQPAVAAAEVRAVLSVLERRGWKTELHHRTDGRRGIAEQRDFLLSRATAPLVLCLDDDVLLERWAIGRLVDAIHTLDCGFVGMAHSGPSYLADVRPDEQEAFELWDGQVQPEVVRKGDAGWDRWRLHNAANPQHLVDLLDPDALDARGWVAYKVAWIAGCVLFRTASLRAAGGFAFWSTLPPTLRGEDIVAQLRVMQRDGGAALLPSGAWHLELPTTLGDRSTDAYTSLVEEPERGGPRPLASRRAGVQLPHGLPTEQRG